MSPSSPQYGPKYTVVVLAGQRSGVDPVAAARGVSLKALVPVGGQAMILNVLDVLEDSPWVGDIYVALDDKNVAAREPRLNRYLESGYLAYSGTSSCHSVVTAITEKNIQPPFLVMTADHALLTADMVEHFCTHVERNHREDDADFIFALVSRRAFRAKYPHTRRTFVPFRDDAYSGCNMYAFMTPRALRVLDFWMACEVNRKTPWRQIRAFGFINLIRYILRREGLKEMIAHGGRVLGVRGAAVTMPQPEAAIDIDTPQDLTLAEEILAARTVLAQSMAVRGSPAE